MFACLASRAHALAERIVLPRPHRFEGVDVNLELETCFRKKTNRDEMTMLGLCSHQAPAKETERSSSNVETQEHDVTLL